MNARSLSQRARSKAVRLLQLITARDMAWARGRLMLYWELDRMVKERR